jgi:hypothetical protein
MSCYICEACGGYFDDDYAPGEVSPSGLGLVCDRCSFIIRPEEDCWAFVSVEDEVE